MNIEKFYLESEGISIYSELYLPQGDPPYPTVCVCHGIPARAPESGDRGYPVLAETICREGFAVSIFNFRGAGQSGGNFDIKGWIADLKTVVDHLLERPEIDHSRLCLAGFSAGAAVAVYVAAHESRISSVISCACPAEFVLFSENNVLEVIQRLRRIGVIRDSSFPPSVSGWLGHFREIMPEAYIAKISPRPLLILHGSADETVPVSHAYRLFNQAGERKKLVIIPGAVHRLRLDTRAVGEIVSFLKGQAGSPPF